MRTAVPTNEHNMIHHWSYERGIEGAISHDVHTNNSDSPTLVNEINTLSKMNTPIGKKAGNESNHIESEDPKSRE